MTTSDALKAYQTCARCIMDTTDPHIVFDAEGVCNHCRRFDRVLKQQWWPNEHGDRALRTIIDRIKKKGAKKPYDCVIGLSGGVDSSYLAYVARRRLDLRLLAVHVDGGWNSELAVKNIEGIVTRLQIDLHTVVVDWDEMRDLQRAFMRASLANQDVPQDHAFIAGLYREAARHGIRYVLSGGNIATESVLPSEWAYNAMDLRHIMAIHRRFGERPLKTFPRLNFFQYYFWYPIIRRMKVVRPLNYLPYIPEQAIRVLESEVGYRYYGGKHFESRFTKWQQLHYRPPKFGYDSRRAHLSSLVLSGQMSREEALATLAESQHHDAEHRDEDSEYVRKKLAFSKEEFARILSLPPKTHRDYPCNADWFEFKNRLKGQLAEMGVSVAPRS